MTMTSNTPVSLNQDTAIVEHESHENIPIAPELGSNEQPDKIEENIDASQKVLESAKDEGFLKALTHLAEGDFDDSENKDSEVPAEDAEEVQEEVKEEKENQVEKNEEDKDPEDKVLVARIKELESKVVDLEDRNKKLFEQVKSLQENNKLALETLLEMTLILQKIIEDKEDNEEKVSLLELLIEVMGQLMKQMFVPDDGSTNENNNTQTKSTPKKGKPRMNAKEAMELLRQRGLIDSPEPESKPKETSTPLIENASS